MPKTKRRAVEEEVVDLGIDLNELHIQCAKQPDLYGQFAEQLADAKRDHDEAEAELKRVVAELDKRIRSKPHKFDLPEKITEKMVESTIILQDEYQEAQKNVIAAKHQVNLLSGETTRLEHRKRMLTKIVDLRLNDYYSEVPMTSKARDTMRPKKKAKRTYKEDEEDEDDD